MSQNIRAHKRSASWEPVLCDSGNGEHGSRLAAVAGVVEAMVGCVYGGHGLAVLEPAVQFYLKISNRNVGLLRHKLLLVLDAKIHFF